MNNIKYFVSYIDQSTSGISSKMFKNITVEINNQDNVVEELTEAMVDKLNTWNFTILNFIKL